jgi:hypothetical protein
MPLITTIEELKSFTNAVSLATFPDDLAPSLATIEDSVIADIIGTAQLADLQAAYAASIADPGPVPLSDRNMKLWTAINKVLVPLAIIDFINNTMASTSAAGTGESSASGMASARMWVTVQKKENLQRTAQRAIDNLYVFLETNKADYELWTASDQYTEFKELLVQTTKQFNDIVEIGGSRKLFLRLRASISEVEKMFIIPLIGQPFYDALITALKGTPDANQIAAVKALREAIIRLSMSRTPLPLMFDEHGVYYISSDATNTGEAISRNPSRNAVNEQTMDAYKLQLMLTGQGFLAQAKKYLNATASDTIFPEYFNNPAVYSDPTTQDLSSVNDRLNNTFVL